jgi:hypothetical protein
MKYNDNQGDSQGGDTFVTKDSGERENMDSGSRRDTQKGKPRADLFNPLVSKRVGQLFANGAVKYGEHNFELGQKTSRYLASLQRHLDLYKEGMRDEDHLAAIIWNTHGIMMNEEFVKRGIYPHAMDDFTDYRDKRGFDHTVGKRALEFNEKLRDKEAEQAAEAMQIEMDIIAERETNHTTRREATRITEYLHNRKMEVEMNESGNGDIEPPGADIIGDLQPVDGGPQYPDPGDIIGCPTCRFQFVTHKAWSDVCKNCTNFSQYQGRKPE